MQKQSTFPKEEVLLEKKKIEIKARKDRNEKYQNLF